MRSMYKMTILYQSLHSIKFVAVIISKFRVGIDIEKITKKPLRLSSKFIANSQHFPLSEEKATLIWCCKKLSTNGTKKEKLILLLISRYYHSL